MADTWDFLDKENFNLLYSFAEVFLSEGKKQHHLTINNLNDDSDDIREHEIARIKLAKERKRRAYYLIWFVYRYVLQCETYEDAKPYMNKKTLALYHIESYVRNNIYIGADEDTVVLGGGLLVRLGKMWFHDIKDIEIILDILYHRYDFFEQFECFISHTSKSRKKRATEILEHYRELERVLK